MTEATERCDAGGRALQDLDSDEIKARLFQMLESRDYWIVPVWTTSAAIFANELSRGLYSGVTQREFHAVRIKWLADTVFVFARKSYATPEQITRVLRRVSGSSVDARDLETHDVLACTDYVLTSEELDQFRTLSGRFHQWMRGSLSDEDAWKVLDWERVDMEKPDPSQLVEVLA